MPNVFDFNPTSINPFPYWKWNKVLPAVYDDSLSQYEILCKLLDTVNNIITSTNSTGEQVEQLTQLVQQLIDGQFPSGIVQYVTDIVNAAMADDIERINESLSNMQTAIDNIDASVAFKTSDVIGDVLSAGNIRNSIPFESDYNNTEPHSIVFVEDNTVKNALAASGFEHIASGGTDYAWSITLANSYAVHHESLYYGNIYVPIGFEGSLAQFNRINPKLHRNSAAQMEIDCNTLTQMCGHGVLWDNSNYVLDNQMRFGHKMFDERSKGVIPYWFYGSQSYRDPNNFVGARLITDSFAKFLYDHGQLEYVTPNDAFELGIGRIYFAGNASERFMGINHCYMVTGQLAPTIDGTFVTESYQSTGYSVISRSLPEYDRTYTKAAFTPPWNATRFVNQYSLRGYMVKYENRDINANPITWDTDDTYYGARVIAISIAPDGNSYPTTIRAVNHVTNEVKEVNVNIYGEYLAYFPAQWDITINCSRATDANVYLQIVPSDNFICMPSRP